jgi:hypothetical protein
VLGLATPLLAHLESRHVVSVNTHGGILTVPDFRGRQLALLDVVANRERVKLPAFRKLLDSEEKLTRLHLLPPAQGEGIPELGLVPARGEMGIRLWLWGCGGGAYVQPEQGAIWTGRWARFMSCFPPPHRHVYAEF